MKSSTEERRQVLAGEVFSRCYLVGEFTLRSGRSASRYFDKYQFESDPELLRSLAEEMVALVPDETELAGGFRAGRNPSRYGAFCGDGHSCCLRQEGREDLRDCSTSGRGHRLRAREC